MQEIKEQNAGMATLLYMLIGMGVLLTFVAVVSNQIIGFSGRRRECAVLVSTAMSRGKLKKAFFSESLISSIVALIVAVPFAAVVSGLFQKALELIEMNFGLTVDILPTLAFIFGLFLLSGLQDRIHEEKLPKAFRGFPIQILTAAIIALALTAFNFQ